MSGSPLYPPIFHWALATGAPAVGYLLNTYAAGTSTPQATYTDSTLTVPNTNPVVLNASGNANVFLGGLSYKFVLTDASAVVQWTEDNISLAGVSGVQTISEWNTVAGVPSFNSGTQFQMSGNLTSTFLPKLPLQANLGSGVFVTGWIGSSSFGGGQTTVNVFNMSSPLTAGLTSVAIGIVDKAGQVRKTALSFQTVSGASLTTNTQYTLGAASPFVQTALAGDDFTEVTTGTITVKDAGRYLISGDITLTVNGATVTNPGTVQIFQNGSGIGGETLALSIGTGGTTLNGSCTFMVFASAGDAINVRLANGPAFTGGPVQSGVCTVTCVQVV